MASKEDICSEQIFQHLFLEYSKSLFNYIFYKSSNSALAEDIVQEAFLKLWQKCKKVSKDKAKSYLFTTANNLFLDQVKHQKVVLKFQLRPPSSKLQTEDGQFILEEKEFYERLEKRLAELPENQRIVFLMNRVENMKYKEIAELLGLSVKAVEKRMSMALKSLRAINKNI